MAEGFVKPAISDAELLDLMRRLDRWNCQCGSGGGMACDDDCPGDTTPAVVVEALTALIHEVLRLRTMLPPEGA